MLHNKKIGFIGTGNMGQALIAGLIQSKTAKPDNIICSDINKKQLEIVKNKYNVLITTNNLKVIEKAEIIIYATKPQNLFFVIKETSKLLNSSKLIISIAAGVPLKAIAKALNQKLRLIRVMPNICAFIRESATGIAPSENIIKGDIELAKAVFDCVGKTVLLEENNLDAFTGLAGSGPGYIFMIIDAMADAGVKMGLSRKDSLFLSSQTVMGAAKLILKTKEHPGQLKDKVASPKGTTIEGIHALEQGKLRATLINAIEAATNKSIELGKNIIK